MKDTECNTCIHFPVCEVKKYNFKLPCDYYKEEKKPTDLSDIDVSKYITVWECNCSECGKQKVMAVDDLNYLPMFKKRPTGH